MSEWVNEWGGGGLYPQPLHNDKHAHSDLLSQVSVLTKHSLHTTVYKGEKLLTKSELRTHIQKEG